MAGVQGTAPPPGCRGRAPARQNPPLKHFSPFQRGLAYVIAAQFVLGGGELEKGDYGLPVVGLQLILRDGFGLLDGAADGDFGSGTREAVKDLAAKMQDVLPVCEDMEKGVVDAAFWRNMLAYMDRMN